MEDVCMFMYGNLLDFTAIWYILRPFGIFVGGLVYLWEIRYGFPVLACCTKKNLATLVESHVSPIPPFRR
jgi:hypothetical protein